VQLAVARDPVGNGTEGERDRTALAKPVHAEAREVGRGVGEIELARRLELLAPSRVAGRHVRQYSLELGVTEGVDLTHVHELAVLADDRRLAHLQVDVTGAEADGTEENRVEIH
jgi:hypothetical protein